MPKLKFALESEAKVLDIPNRDFGLLFGPRPFMPNGEELIREFGVFEHFDVASGHSSKPEVTRERHRFVAALRAVAHDIDRDSDLLSFDYFYSFSTAPKKRLGGAQHGFQVKGRHGGVDSQPKGFLTVTILDRAPTGVGRPAEILDLRVLGQLETENMGVLKAHRRVASLSLPAIIDELLSFLDSHDEPTVRVLNRW